MPPGDWYIALYVSSLPVAHTSGASQREQSFQTLNDSATIQSPISETTLVLYVYGGQSRTLDRSCKSHPKDFDISHLYYGVAGIKPTTSGLQIQLVSLLVRCIAPRDIDLLGKKGVIYIEFIFTSQVGQTQVIA